MHTKIPAKHFEEIMSPPIVGIVRLADKMERKGRTVIRSTGQGVPFLDPPAYALKEISEEIKKSNSIHAYSPDPGLPEVREAVCNYLQKVFSLVIEPENLLLTAGSNMGFFMLVNAIIEPGRGDEVLFSVPYYFNHVMAVQMAGGQPVFARPEFGLGLDPKSLKSVASKNTRAIVTVSPNNPSGAVFSKASFEGLSEIFKEQEHIILISDEVYSTHIFGKNQHCSPGSLSSLRNFTCTLGSCSKSFGLAGWRLGWLGIPTGLESLFETVLKIQDTTNIAAPTISQSLLLAILQGPYETYIKQSTQLLETNWRFVTDWIKSASEDLPVDFPQAPEGAFYLFPQFKGYQDSRTLAMDLLKEKGVVTIPGIAFGEESHLRISYGGRLREVENAFDRIDAFLKEQV